MPKMPLIFHTPITTQMHLICKSIFQSLIMLDKERRQHKRNDTRVIAGGEKLMQILLRKELPNAIRFLGILD